MEGRRPAAEDSKVDGSNQLRDELRAQQAVCRKLMREKEEALQMYAGAMEEISSLHEQLDLQEQAFQEFRETRERKITELTRIVQNLEMMLRGGGKEMEDEAGGGVLEGVGTSSMLSTMSSHLPQLSAKEIVESLSKWDGMEDIVAEFDGMVKKEKAPTQWVPGSPWSGVWQFVIRMYVSAPADVHDALDHFIKVGVGGLKEVCRQGGCCLLPVFINSPEVSTCSMNDQLLPVCRYEIERSNIFVGLLGSSVDMVTKTEFEHGYINNPNVRPAVFAFLQAESEDVATRKLKQRVKNVGKYAKIIEHFDSIERTLTEVSKEIQRICQEELGVLEPAAASGSGASEFKGIALLADMRQEWEQAQLLAHLVAEAPPTLIGMEELTARLNNYLREEDLVQTCLVTGHTGFGTSTVIAKWPHEKPGYEVYEITYSNTVHVHDRKIDFLHSTFNDHVLILHHFVQHLCSSSAEPTLILRRFIQKMMFHCGDSEGIAIPDNPSKLVECFTSWLQTLSANLGKPGPEMAIIIIESAEHITNCEQTLSWALGPLPSNIRVILSANEDNCPDSWRVLPSPSVPTPTGAELKDIMMSMQSKLKLELLTDDHVTMISVYSPYILLWSGLALKFMLSLEPQHHTPEAIDEQIEGLSEFEEMPELVKLILDTLEANNPLIADCMEKVLQLVYWSRDGLLLTELEEMTCAPSAILSLLLYELRRRSIVSDVTGLVQFTHAVVQEAVELKYCVDPIVDYMVLWGEMLIAHFSALTRPGCLLSRCAEELLWLLKRAELKEELFHVVINTDMLIQLYASGRSGELFSYWQCLDPTLNVMAAQYYKSLLRIEEQDAGNSSMFIASLHSTVGKIIRNLGFTDEAMSLLQHSLDMFESHDDPDGDEVGMALCELAVLCMQANRHNTAEGYCKQALQTLEMVCGEDSAEVLKVLEIMDTVYKELQRDDMADSLTTRIYSVRQAVSAKSTPSGLLKAKSMELEQFCSSSSDSSLEAARKLNQLGAIFSTYGDSEAAEDLLMRSMKTYESLIADDDVIMSEPLRNLGTFYMQSDRLEWATSLLEPALKILSKHVPETDSRRVDTINKLGLLYREQGRLDLAEPLQSELTRLRELEYGPNDLRVGKALNNLAVLCCLQGSYDKAVPLYDRAIKIYKENLGMEHQTVLVAMKNRQIAVDSMQHSHTD